MEPEVQRAVEQVAADLIHDDLANDVRVVLDGLEVGSLSELHHLVSKAREEPDYARHAFDLKPGDRVLVDVSHYESGAGPCWCEVVSVALGSAAGYPYQGQVPDRGSGQHAARAI